MQVFRALPIDAAGRLTSTTDRLTRRKDYTYDNADRLTLETWINAGSGTAQLLTYSYDNADNLLTAANAAGTTTLAYDSIDRVTKVQEPFAVTLTYVYDAASNRTVVQDNFGGFLTSTYDAANRLTSRQSNGGTGSARARRMIISPAAQSLPAKPADHTNGAVMNPLSDQFLFDIISKGGSAVGKSTFMPSWGSALNEKQIKDIVAHLRSIAEPPYKAENNGKPAGK
jgi:YD repeat-containing protein